MEYTSRLVGVTRRIMDGDEIVLEEYEVNIRIGNHVIRDIIIKKPEEKLEKLILERIKNIKPEEKHHEPLHL